MIKYNIIQDLNFNSKSKSFDNHNIRLLTHWHDNKRNTDFCLIEAPSKQAVYSFVLNYRKIHFKSIIEVNNTLAETYCSITKKYLKNNDCIKNDTDIKEYFIKKLKKEEILNQGDENFIRLFLDTLEGKINQPNYTILELAKNIGVSKSKLYRTVISLTKRSPQDFIKEYRLEKSVTLLRQKNKNISEIAFETGFSSPSYFSKCFKIRYGTIPSEHIR